MNILYIGPYRDQSINGLISLNHIRSLQNYCSLTIKPIFLSNNRIKTLDQDILNLENRQLSLNKYDACIQHAPIDYLISFKLVSDKNYCIPIIPHIYNQDKKSQYSRILSYFDTIFYDSQYDSTCLKNTLNGKKKYKLFSYSESLIDPAPINISPIYKKQYKFYTFIHKESYRFINKILLSFLSLQKKISTCCLIIAVDSDYSHKLVQDNLNFLIKKLNLKHIDNHIKLISLEFTENNIISLHKSGNCCINIRDYTNSGFQNHIAHLHNNAVITNDNLSQIEDIELSDHDDTYIRFGLNPIELSEKMKNSINTVPIYNSNNIQTIDKLICKQ